MARTFFIRTNENSQFPSDRNGTAMLIVKCAAQHLTEVPDGRATIEGSFKRRFNFVLPNCLEFFLLRYWLAAMHHLPNCEHIRL